MGHPLIKLECFAPNEIEHEGFLLSILIQRKALGIIETGPHRIPMPQTHKGSLGLSVGIYLVVVSMIAPVVSISGELKNTNLSNFGLTLGSIVKEKESSTTASFVLATNNRLTYQDTTWYHQFNTRLNLQILVVENSGSTKSPPIQPIENLLFGELVLSRRAKFALDPFVSASIQTPLIQRFSVLSGNLEDAFADPLVGVLSAGLAHQIVSTNRVLSLRLGLSYNVLNAKAAFRLTDNPHTASVEYGLGFSSADFVADYQEPLDSIVTIVARLDVKYGTKYRPFWATILDVESRVSLSKVFGMIAKVRLVYDDRTSYRVLSTSSIQVGIVLSN